MTSERFSARMAVYLILIKDGRVLLLHRFNTGWSDGKYAMIGGHVDGDESVTDAMIREAKEEAGIELDKERMRVAHTMHRKSAHSGLEYIDFFLIADAWKGEPKNMEPHKSDGLEWFPLDDLPADILPHVKLGIENSLKGIGFSEFGWNGDAY